jgi:hypothetical protein
LYHIARDDQSVSAISSLLWIACQVVSLRDTSVYAVMSGVGPPETLQKVQLSSKANLTKYLPAPGKLVEAYGADLQDDSKDVLRKVIATFRVAMQECIAFEDDPMNAPAGVGPSDLWRADDLREVQQLAAAVRQQEASLRTLQDAVGSDIDSLKRDMEANVAAWAETERLPLAEMQPEQAACAEDIQDLHSILKGQHQRLCDELTNMQSCLLVVQSKTNESAKRHKSLLPDVPLT